MFHICFIFFFGFVALSDAALANQSVCPKNFTPQNSTVEYCIEPDEHCIICESDDTDLEKSIGNVSVLACACHCETTRWQRTSLFNSPTDSESCVQVRNGICGFSWNLEAMVRSESLALTGLLTCAQENVNRTNWELGTIMCPNNSTLRSVDAVGKMVCYTCHWNNDSLEQNNQTFCLGVLPMNDNSTTSCQEESDCCFNVSDYRVASDDTSKSNLTEDDLTPNTDLSGEAADKNINQV